MMDAAVAGVWQEQPGIGGRMGLEPVCPLRLEPRLQVAWHPSRLEGELQALGCPVRTLLQTGSQSLGWTGFSRSR